MKKRVTLVLAVCALAVAVPFSAVAGNGPNNKVTGSMSFMNGVNGLGNFTFSGHDVVGGVDKGTASYSDMNGSWSGIATSVEVTGPTSAKMTVTVTSTTHQDVLLGSSHTFHFNDLGEAGINTGELGSDYFTYGADPTHHNATAGNIQLHYVVS